MNDSVKCDVSSLEDYKKNIIRFYDLQVAHFKELKRKFNNVMWSDEKLLDRINQINDCLEKIADAIENLSDGYHVKVVDGFLEQAHEYLKTRSNYPR